MEIPALQHTKSPFSEYGEAAMPVDYDEAVLKNSINTLRLIHSFDMSPVEVEGIDEVATKGIEYKRAVSNALLECYPEIKDILDLSQAAITDYFPEFMELAPIKNVTFFKSGEVGKEVSPLAGVAALSLPMLIIQADANYFSSMYRKLEEVTKTANAPGTANYIADAILGKMLIHEYVHYGSTKIHAETGSESVVAYSGVEMMIDGPHGPQQGINELITDYLALKCTTRNLEKRGLTAVIPFLGRPAEYDIANFFDSLVGEEVIKVAYINNDIDTIAEAINNPKPDSGFEADPLRFDSLNVICQELMGCQTIDEASVVDDKLKEFMQIRAKAA